MAQEKSFTPEKQLLKLIEEQGIAKSSNVKQQTVRHRRKGLFSLGGWISRFSFTRDRLKKWFTKRRVSKPDVKTVNRILVLLVLALLIYLAYSVYISINNLERLPGLGVEPAQGKAAAESATVLSILRDKVSYYLEKAAERDIFKMGIKEPVAEQAEVATGPSSRAIAATENLRLVGISWSSNPDAMIEDKKALKTFFVKKGDMINKVKVEAIFKDKVILSFEAERVELK